MMVRLAAGLATDAAGADVLAAALRRGPVTTLPAFGAGLRDRAVDDEDVEPDDVDALCESGDPESA